MQVRWRARRWSSAGSLPEAPWVYSLNQFFTRIFRGESARWWHSRWDSAYSTSFKILHVGIGVRVAVFVEEGVGSKLAGPWCYLISLCYLNHRKWMQYRYRPRLLCPALSFGSRAGDFAVTENPLCDSGAKSLSPHLDFFSQIVLTYNYWADHDGDLNH